MKIDVNQKIDTAFIKKNTVKRNQIKKKSYKICTFNIYLIIELIHLHKKERFSMPAFLCSH